MSFKKMRIAKIIKLAALLVTLVSGAEGWCSAHSVPTYQIKDQISLGEISTFLYGTSKRAMAIAELNHLKAPAYRVRMGQKLKLPRAATITAQAGNELLLKMWRRRLQSKPVRVAVSTSKPRVIASVAEKPAPVPVETRPTVFEKKVEAAQEEESVESGTVYQKGLLALEQKNYLQASKLFYKARSLDPQYVAAWISEIRTATLMGDSDRAATTACTFKARFPNLRELPVIQSVASQCD